MTQEPAHKVRLDRKSRLLRLLGSFFDPRAWMHAVKLINYYNYTHVTPLRQLKVGTGCAISPNAVFANAERITLGSGVSIGARCTLWAGPREARLILRDDVLLGPDVLLTASNYRFNDGQPVTRQAMDEADVVIGRDAWLGAKVVVLPGARIGDGAIVGAGAVVRGNIPEFAIAVGAPARVVGRRQIPDDYA